MTAVNLFTVDLEEWFHVCGVGGPLAPEHWGTLPSRVELTTRLLLETLDRAQVPATFFAVGWVAERHPRLIEDISAAGHDIGSHSQSHTRVYELTPEAFRRELLASRKALCDAGAATVTAFRAPEWSVNGRSLWALDVLAQEGFSTDASMAPVKIVGDPAFPRSPHHRHTPHGSILEVPPFVVDRFHQVMPMGWGWALRMSSPRRVLREIERANRNGVGAVFTVHPWELDPEPPRARLRPSLHFAHYFRLSGFHDRLRSILDGARFGRLREIAV